jgi:FolB domain-containing protein
MNAPDEIRIASLELEACVGVPDDERAKPQRLTVSLTIVPARDFAGLDDDITRTVDYAAVTAAIRALAAARPRRLIETLAEEIAQLVLERFGCRHVDLELRKYILPETEYVAVRLRRTKSPLSPRSP